MECRHDWHQTATHVVVAIYGKKYDPDTSYVELSPVRMKCHIVFPEQGGFFNMDIELRGVSLSMRKLEFSLISITIADHRSGRMQSKFLRHKSGNQDAKSRGRRLVQIRHPTRNYRKERINTPTSNPGCHRRLG